MSLWLTLPIPKQITDGRTGAPISEPVFDDKDGERRVRCDDNGNQIGKLQGPWTLLNFMERYVFVSRFVPAGVKGAKFVRRLRKCLADVGPRVMIDEADIELVRSLFERIEKADNEAVERGLPRAWDASILEQCIEFIECWDKGAVFEVEATALVK